MAYIDKKITDPQEFVETPLSFIANFASYYTQAKQNFELCLSSTQPSPIRRYQRGDQLLTQLKAMVLDINSKNKLEFTCSDQFAAMVYNLQELQEQSAELLHINALLNLSKRFKL